MTTSEKYDDLLEWVILNKRLSDETVETLKSLVSDLCDEAFERGVESHNL